MEPNESTEGSRSRSLDVQPCTEEIGTTSEPFLSSDGGGGSAMAAATMAADAAAAAAATASTARATALFTKTPAPYSGFTDPSSDNLFGTVYAAPQQIGHGLGFEPLYVSSFARDPCTTTDFSSSAVPPPGFSSDPVTGSSSSPVLVPSFNGYGSFPGSSSAPDHGSVPSSFAGPGIPISGFRTGPGPDTIPHSGTGPGPANIPRSGPGPGPATIPCSGPGPGPATIPRSGTGPGPATATLPCSGTGPGPATIPNSGIGRGSDQGSGPASGASPGSSPGPELRPSSPQRFRNLRPDLFPNYTSRNQYCHWEPQKQPPWEFLQVSEPGTRGLRKTPEGEGKPKFLYETLPRGQCLLYNWEEERATNHLDQVPNWQDISESFFFRHGHQGLLTMQPHSPMPSSTTQKDSYQSPRNLSQPLRGKREAMVEMLLHHQICKEVQADLEPIRKPFEVESVTHHDYRMELVQAGPPAPTKPHDYRQEQPETFWLQRAPQLPGVSNIRTLDTPFRKNCSFSTPVPLSLGQPLPYELENYPHQLGEISSLACQGEGQRQPGDRITPV